MLAGSENAIALSFSEGSIDQTALAAVGATQLPADERVDAARSFVARRRDARAEALCTEAALQRSHRVGGDARL